ncbi:DASH family cryptochrome [Idiomarina aminovorans]|uniref:DASH family cryptochrome n=1 Tax=Idiomarina aminovorans TaxID=2914829 RepID=UPI00200595ED|nr:DASH family cryptochrome [Idiomarina sp. ATCH4]MCK7460371.1 DASH family cryptochrome [Idiomarina sp. ATCH4]
MNTKQQPAVIMADYQLGLFIFRNDLRVEDNLALQQAAQRSKTLICCFCFNPDNNKHGHYGIPAMSQRRVIFLQQSLRQLSTELESRGQKLIVLTGTFDRLITELISEQQVDAVFLSQHQGYYEKFQLGLLQRRFPFLPFHEISNNTLFSEHQLPFRLNDLPDTFTQFRKKVELLDKNFSLQLIHSLPPSPKQINHRIVKDESIAVSASADFEGGAIAGAEHLQRYFSGQQASTYKQTRNALDDFPSSTKFSPWLALGCLSVRQIMAELRAYEAQFGENESSYWISFELLWREYFFWYALKHGKRLFAFSGISGKSPKTSFYSERFQKWCSGNTPYPIVNACMKQLNATGYMSNRGRQLVASCFVHELSLDWRYGAAYFEQQLMDYDVSSNWGNWQYLAGVGADPRGHRQFNLEKQAERYDPDNEFIERWAGDLSGHPIDSVDAADWPVR